jgi:hypothetical protein
VGIKLTNKLTMHTTICVLVRATWIPVVCTRARLKLRLNLQHPDVNNSMDVGRLASSSVNALDPYVQLVLYDPKDQIRC